MRVKGHALVWHGATPKWVEALSPPELRIAFEDHIRTWPGTIAAGCTPGTW